MDEFTLTLRLGNDAMQTPEDIATALRRLAGLLDEYGFDCGQSILDQNGNKVGEWVAR